MNVSYSFNRGRVFFEFSFSISITLESGYFFQTKQKDPVNIVMQSRFENKVCHSPLHFLVFKINVDFNRLSRFH